MRLGPEHGEPQPGELLTEAEHAAVKAAGDLWNQLCAIVADGPAREGDLRELVFHIHAIQRAVLKQAAARAYPELYRVLGGDPPTPPPVVEFRQMGVDPGEVVWSDPTPCRLLCCPRAGEHTRGECGGARS